ncbi:hypothetical protein V6N13_096516 [Hibiscus sabdariffa]|uniref:Uncharacterized protein n=1 Tax=Hibiscus sabdariffa TaxID=183260 RepID=A0ABR2DFG8_9ROSI
MEEAKLKSGSRSPAPWTTRKLPLSNQKSLYSNDLFDVNEKDVSANLIVSEVAAEPVGENGTEFYRFLIHRPSLFSPFG